METREFWSRFSTSILEHLTSDDDPNLWETAIATILADAHLLCQSSRSNRPINAQIGACSHWMSPHNARDWFHDNEKFAWPTGYGSSGLAVFGLPEFDWSLLWEWSHKEAQ